MSSTRSAGWVGGTVFLVLVILGATYFFLAAPRFEAAAATRTAAEDTRTRNEILQQENARLKADFANLETYKTELVALQTQIPTRPQLTEFARAVDGLAATRGVFVAEVSPGVAQAVTIPTPAVEEEPTPAPTEGEETAEEPEGGADPVVPVEPGEPAGPIQIDGFYAIPVVVKVVGPYANVSAFLNDLQTGTPRSFLVTNMEGVRQSDAEPSGGKPATVAGDVEMTISGFAYVLQAPLGAVPVPAEGETPVEAPLPSSDRNPFTPIAGSLPAPTED